MAKSIVVFHWGGGHDGYNMFVPLDRYSRYAELRGDIAQPYSSMIPLNLGHGNLAIHGSFTRVTQMIQSGLAAPILGTGNLIEATTLPQMKAKTVKLPPFLGSHSHQSTYNKGAVGHVTGWGGRMLDAWYANKTKPYPINPALALIQDRKMLASDTLGVTMLRSEGETWQGLTGNKQTAVASIAAHADYAHIMERVAKGVLSDAINGQDYLQNIFSQYTASGKLPTGATIAAKLIAAADQLGHDRQILHVGVPGGWDSHAMEDFLNEPYTVVDNLFADFLEELEMYGVADNVVCITASEFGRTITSNGRGTDHGWGNNQLVFGNPVLGNQVIGEFVDYDDTDYLWGGNKIIPKLSDTQSYATIGKWFGLNTTQLETVFPELKNFAQKDLGFLN